MNKIFEEEIRETLEVYMDNLIVKSSEEEWRDEHFTSVFRRVPQYNMRLNPKNAPLESEPTILKFLLNRNMHIRKHKQV